MCYYRLSFFPYGLNRFVIVQLHWLYDDVSFNTV